MSENRIRHMFPGNNTGRGFFSYFAHILPQPQRVYCLKGGPGVGKSTLLKRISQRMVQQGLQVEHMHCASDPDSLDALVIPALGVALLDGTAPHIIDPVYPAAVDEIVNLGDFWDAAGIRQNRDGIIRISGENKACYRRTFQYLAAAACLMEDIAATRAGATDEAGALLEARRIVQRELEQRPFSRRLGGVRRLFASAITPDGVVHYANSLPGDGYTVYTVAHQWGGGVHQMLESVADEAVRRGLDIELYYCPLAPDTRAEHLIIPQQKLALLSKIPGVPPQQSRYEVDLEQYTDADALAADADALAFDTATFDTLLDAAVRTLAQTRALHDELEVYYSPHMDFTRVRQKEDELCAQILALPAWPPR
ncbi:MAG: hypothetical protein PHO66_06600 [Eubacteriales bacterium]|nr:hypothetical protein [Eubacteriales bacterium]